MLCPCSGNGADMAVLLLLVCPFGVCTGANDQQSALQQKQKQLEESKQELAKMREVAEPDRL